MNNKKICFFDVDGTLTDERGGASIVIPESTIKALHQAHEAGVLLFVNTGRPLSTIPQEVRNLPMDGFICGCGTWIMMHGKELYRHEIVKEERIKIMRKVDELRLSCVYEGKEGFAVVDHLNLEQMQRIVNTYIDNGFKLLEVSDDLVFEKFCLFKNSTVPWPDLSFVDEYDQFYKSDFFCEIVPNACSKGKAIVMLMEMLNIPEENGYGFGDSENDVEMLKVIHHRVVMGHAPEQIKKLADYVTEEASKDGLYNAMVHLGLIEEGI